MKPLKLLAIINKSSPRIEFNNLLPLKDKKNVRLLKGEKIEETITMTKEDLIALCKREYLRGCIDEGQLLHITVEALDKRHKIYLRDNPNALKF